MAEDTKPLRFKHGLSFVATLAFVGGFFSVMIFTPSGIHFHHFWYGLAMMGVSGWLGIVDNDVKFARIYAVVFGVGAGFVGDEVGLLLTFDDYYSELTLDFFVAAIAFIILAVLLLRYRDLIVPEVLRLSRHERIAYIGVFLVGFSLIFVAVDRFEIGAPLIVVGLVLFAWGFRRKLAKVVNAAP